MERKKPRGIVLLLSNALIIIGAVILVGTFGLYGYSQYQQNQANREAAQLTPLTSSAWTPVALVAVEPTITPLPTTTPGLDDRTSMQVRQQEERRIALANRPTATPTAVPIFPAERIVAPTIKLDSKVVESPIVNGEWVVPKFVAGHLAGTAQPLEGGNVVLSGHVQSISSGNVFANIGSLKAGDPIRLYTKATVVTYRVDQTKTVANTDLDVLEASPSETLTLITCTGTWLPLERDYDRRLIVVATRIDGTGT